MSSGMNLFKQLDLKKAAKVDCTNHKRDYLNDFLKYLKMGLPPQVYIDSIIPVYFDARKASSCFSDMVHFQSIDDFPRVAEELKKDYGIYMQLLLIDVDITTGMAYLFFSKNKKLYDEIAELQNYCDKIIKQSKTSKEAMFSIFNDAKVIRMMGDILGFPKCCVEDCVNIRKKKDLIEVVAVERLMKNKNKAKLPVFFTFEFYPCKVDCKNAMKVGEKVERAVIDNTFLTQAWFMMLQMNVDRIVNPQINHNQLLDKLNKELYVVFRQHKPNGMFEHMQDEMKKVMR